MSDSGPWTPPILNISLSATRFQPGIPAQNRSIHEWLYEKKTRKSRRKAAIYDENDGREDVIFVEPPEKVPENDQKSEFLVKKSNFFQLKKPNPTPKSTGTDGDFIVLGSDSDDDVVQPKTDDNWIFVDGKKFSKMAWRHLPPDIKKVPENSEKSGKNPNFRRKNAKIGPFLCEF